VSSAARHLDPHAAIDDGQEKDNARITQAVLVKPTSPDHHHPLVGSDSSHAARNEPRQQKCRRDKR
jgi:hypothetical protein